MIRLTLLLPLLLGACIAALPPEGTPYFALYDGGDNLYAASTVTYYGDGTVLYTAEPHGENDGRGAQSVEQALGVYEAALEALEAPTPEDLAAEAAYNAADPNACCHVYFFRECTWFDGAQTQNVPLYACNRAATHRLLTTQRP